MKAEGQHWGGKPRRSACCQCLTSVFPWVSPALTCLMLSWCSRLPEESTRVQKHSKASVLGSSFLWSGSMWWSTHGAMVRGWYRLKGLIVLCRASNLSDNSALTQWGILFGSLDYTPSSWGEKRGRQPSLALLTAEKGWGCLTCSLQNDICSGIRNLQERILECCLHVCAGGEGRRKRSYSHSIN